jgi:hypothetical protein
MTLEIDPDLQAVVEFMQSNLPAGKLAPIARELPALASLLWGHYAPESVTALCLRTAPISADDPRTQSVANG